MKANWRLLVTLASIAFPFTASNASADAIGLSSSLNFCVGVTAAGCTVFRDQISIVDQTSPYSLAPFQDSGEYDTATLDLLFSGAASSSFGSYGASVQASFVGANAPFSFLQFGSGSLDRLTVGHLSFTGQSGELEIHWRVGGTLTSSGQSHAQANLRSCVGLPGSIPLVGQAEPVGGVTCDQAMFATSGVNVVTFRLPILYGSPFDLRNDLITTAQFLAGSGVGNATVDYLHTAGLVGLRAFAADGTAIPDVVFSSESGVQYAAHGVVPEPSSLLLFNLGAIGVIAKARRRKKPQKLL